MWLNKEWTQSITHSEMCYDWIYSQNTVWTKLFICVVAVRMCNSAGKCECCTIRETDNNAECKIITDQIICSSLALLCMNQIYFVTFCFGSGLHPCTFQNKAAAELNWTKRNCIGRKRANGNMNTSIHHCLFYVPVCLHLSASSGCGYVTGEPSLPQLTHPTPLEHVQLTSGSGSHFLFAVYVKVLPFHHSSHTCPAFPLSHKHTSVESRCEHVKIKE